MSMDYSGQADNSLQKTENQGMDDREVRETRFEDAMDDAGDIGEEQMPSAKEAGAKTDKHVWNYLADETTYKSGIGEKFREWFKGQ